MTTSRRGFLHALGAGTVAGIALPWPLIGEPTEITQDNGLIRLDRNENPYGPPPKVLQAIRSSVRSANRYPRREYASLAERIAGMHNVNSGQVLLGCGSTEILRMAAQAFLGSGKQLIQASPTFDAMEEYARAARSEVISIRLTPSFAHDLDGMLARATSSTTLVYICNPNNPTASLTPRKELEDFIHRLPTSTFVVIDEAYHGYAGQSGMYASFIDRPLDHERTIVTRTFSTVYGLAGMRLGYAVAAPGIVRQMRVFATHDNVNALVTEAAVAALEDIEGVNDGIQRNANGRQEFFNQAMARALKPIDSHTNFVMMNTFHPAEDVIQLFRKNKILIAGPYPLLDTHIRVSLGRDEEMRAFWQTWDMLPYPKNTMHH